MRTATGEYRTFLRAAASRPRTIGAIAPSSTALAEQLAAVVPRHGRPTAVELGAGTGQVSAAIRRRLPDAGRQLAVELDPTLVAYLRWHHPWLTLLPGDAANLDSILSGAGVDRVDAVISGLPWSVFGPTQQERTLRTICQVLEPEGVFTTFGYLHALRLRGARSFRALLRHRFDEVLVTRTVWGNLPPALVYVCRRVAHDG